MGVLLLGHVELTLEADGTPVPLAAPKRRAVLAILALRLGHVVPLSRIYELLWGDQAPLHADAAVQGHIAALRKVLPGTGMRIETGTVGYRMLGPADGVDYARFLALVEGAEGGDEDGVGGGDASAGEDDGELRGLAWNGQGGQRERLAAALGLWRGSALAGLSGTDLQRSLAAELEELRTLTLERWARGELAAANAAAAIPALTAAARAEPLRETLIALLIACLHQDGFVEQAQELYERTRKRLAEELGVDPGAPLREAAEALFPEQGAGGAGGHLREADLDLEPEAAQEPGRDTPGAARMLPPAVLTLVGRAAEAERLERVCGPGHDGPGRIVVTGPAGVGKTSTVVHWAHAAATGFPDGQLFADLRGFDPEGAVEPAEVLGAFLTALGLPGEALPEDPDELAALYQSTTRPLRLLVVLDNAASTEHVRALIPEGLKCATVITSRGTLEELSVTAGAATMVIDTLAPADATSLLARTVGAARVAAEPEAAAEIIGYCERLPLALLLCGARLALRPAWRLADAARELADDRARLGALDADGSDRLLHTLHLTRQRLSPDGARLLALLGLHPGAEGDAGSAAALLGLDLAGARHALGDLAAYHLTDEAAPGRHTRHSLVRAYCARLLDQVVSAEERYDALERLMQHYDDVVHEARDQIRGAGKATSRPPAENARVHEWFHREEPVIRALVAQSLEDVKLAGHAAEIAVNVQTLYYSDGTMPVRREQMAVLGVRAGEVCGDVRLHSRALAERGSVYTTRGRYAESLPWLEQAVRVAEGSADPKLRLRALISLNTALVGAGRGIEMVPVFEEMLEVVQEVGDGVQIARTLNNFGEMWINLGDPARGLELVDRSLAVIEEQQLPRINLTFPTLTRAEALAALGRTEEALAAGLHGLELCRGRHLAAVEASAAEFLGGLLGGLGRVEQAAGYLRSAIELYRQQGCFVDEERATARLTALEA